MIGMPPSIHFHGNFRSNYYRLKCNVKTGRRSVLLQWHVVWTLFFQNRLGMSSSKNDYAYYIGHSVGKRKSPEAKIFLFEQRKKHIDLGTVCLTFKHHTRNAKPPNSNVMSVNMPEWMKSVFTTKHNFGSKN